MILVTEREQELLKKAERHVEELGLHDFVVNGERFMRPQTLEIIRDRDYLGMLVPTQYGGVGISSLAYGMVLATLAKGDASAALWLAMHNFAMSEVATRPEVDEATRQRLFELGLHRPLSAGISEPPSTGHLPHTFIPQSVTAERLSDGRWVINGTKKVVTGYYCSHYMMVFAHLKDSPSTTVCLLVPRGTRGMAQGHEWDEVEFFQTTRSNSVTFDNVTVGPEAFVFETENFLTEAVAVYGIRTFGYMAVYLGIFERALEIAIEAVTGRIPTGMTQPLAYIPSVAAAIGTCRRLAKSARLLLQDALEAFDAKAPENPIAGAEEMFHAARAIGELTRTVPLLNEQVGLSVVGGNKEYRQAIKNLSVGGLMPPSNSVADVYSGGLAMRLDLMGLPTIY